MRSNLEIRMNPGMIIWTRNESGKFNFIAGAHGGSYQGICDVERVAKTALTGRLTKSEVIQKLMLLGWDDVIEQIEKNSICLSK